MDISTTASESDPGFSPRTASRAKNLLMFAVAAALALLVSPSTAIAMQRQGRESQPVVEITYPETRTTVGDPIVYSFDVANASSVEEPRVPSVPGLRSDVARSREFTQTAIVNGRVTRQSSIRFDVVFLPERAGVYEIPAIRIVVDGQTYQSRPTRVEVAPFDTGSFVRAEIVVEPTTAVVGENLSVRLRVWLRPQRAGRGTLDISRQWGQTVKARESSWGPFTSAVEELYRDGRWRIPPRVERGQDGEEWYVYEIATMTAPDRPGPLELGEIELRVGLPRTIGGGERLLTVVPTPPQIRVEPVPTAGRPADFTGAVGVFEIEAKARPTRASVGDPITLTLTISDRTPGGGADLARLPPPAIAEQPDLARSFRIPSEPLAGTVNGRTKVFTQTLRPLSERVTEIPPISFSFFDPRTRSFQTVRTQPIPLTVLPGERLDTTTLAGGGIARQVPDRALTEVEGGLVASRPISPAMLAVDRLSIGWGAGGAIVVPPLLALLALLWRRRSDRLGRDDRIRRSMRALPAARRAIRAARDSAAIAAAITGYLADRSGRPSASLTRREALAVITRHDADDALLQDLDELLSCGERAAFGGRSEQTLESQRSRALQLLSRLERLDIAFHSGARP